MLKNTIIEAVEIAAKRGGTRKAIAELANIPPGNLSNYLNGKADLNGASIERLLEVLGLQLVKTARK